MDARRPRKDGVSEAAVGRLSHLLRCLKVLEGEGVRTTSSLALAGRFGLNSAQIRKDLAHLGEFGVRGVGYRVSDLRSRLKAVMGLGTARPVVIVGAGNLGRALADSRNFNGETFRVVALFDVDRTKVGGTTRGGVPILDVSELSGVVQTAGVEIGVLAVPAEAVADASESLRHAGVKGILNFAPAAALALPGTIVKNADLTLPLEALSFQIAHRVETAGPTSAPTA